MAGEGKGLLIVLSTSLILDLDLASAARVLAEHTGFPVDLHYDNILAGRRGGVEEEAVEAYRRALRLLGDRVASIHAPYGGPAEWSMLSSLLEALSPPPRGLRVLVVHPPSHVQGVRETARLLEAPAKWALENNVALGVENLVAGWGVERVVKLVGLLRGEGYATTGLCIDVGHLFLEGRDPAETLKAYGDLVVAIHAHDNHGRSDEHLPPGKGRIPWSRVAEAIATAPGLVAVIAEPQCRGDIERCLEVARKTGSSLLGLLGGGRRGYQGNQ